MTFGIVCLLSYLLNLMLSQSSLLWYLYNIDIRHFGRLMDDNHFFFRLLSENPRYVLHWYLLLKIQILFEILFWPSLVHLSTRFALEFVDYKYIIDTHIYIYQAFFPRRLCLSYASLCLKRQSRYQTPPE